MGSGKWQALPLLYIISGAATDSESVPCNQNKPTAPARQHVRCELMIRCVEPGRRLSVPPPKP